MKIKTNVIIKKAGLLFKDKKLRKLAFFACLGLIVFLSIFPRIIETLNGNPIFGFDQGREMLAAKNIIVNHKLTLIGTEVGAGQAGISGIFHGPIYYYILTIPFVLFNGDPGKVVSLMFLFGILTIIFGYFFGKKLFGQWGGILLALLISLSPVFIAQSRFIWSPNPPTLFILLSLYFTYLLKDKKNKYIFLAAFFAGFIYNFEFGIAVPLSLALLIYCIFLFRKDLKKLVYLFAGFITVYSPMFFFELRHGLIGTKNIILYLTAHHKQAVGQTGVHYLIEHAREFITYFQNTFPVNSYYPLILLLILSLSLFFLVKEKNTAFRNFFSYLLLLIPIAFLVFAPLRNSVWNIYLLHLNVAYLLLFCYITYSFINRKMNIFFIITVFFIALMVFSGLEYIAKISLHDYFDYGGTAKVSGKIDAIDYIYKDEKGKPFGLLVFTPAVYTYPYDYLLWWYGEKKIWIYAIS